jgi:hypothetical protein
MMRATTTAPTLALVLACGLNCCSSAKADDWNNAGGNAGRNGQSAERGPDAAPVNWRRGRSRTPPPAATKATSPLTRHGQLFGFGQQQ